MSFSVNIDTSALKEKISDLQAKIQGAPQHIGDFAESDIVPTLEAYASTERNVITGTYAGTWEVVVDGNVIQITTEADYWVFLELGTQKITAKPVVHDAVGDEVDNLKADLIEYLTE